MTSLQILVHIHPHYFHTIRQAVLLVGIIIMMRVRIKYCLHGQKPEKGISNTTIKRLIKLLVSMMCLAGNADTITLREEEDLHFWHAAYAGCQRITLAYKFVNGGNVNNPEDAQARAMRDMLIDEIESE
mgnify:CR=1 FL=1